VVTGEMPRAEAASYLSGLILGKDVGTVRELMGLSGTVHLICTPSLAALYEMTLDTYDLDSAVLDGDSCALAGLIHIHSELFA
jgi:2-dehydro-3-deoxygalactonokinase